MASEVLSRLLFREEKRGFVHEIRIGNKASSISYLMFADNTILFFRASFKEIEAVWTCVEKYQACSSQEVTLLKSELMFSRNCFEELRRGGIEHTTQHEEC